jgi:cyclopropane fatty-acyl-phospholipid synthase-like methyltransferase
MDDIKKSVVEALDGNDTGLYPFLPYLLQDLWEFGADPYTIASIVRQHISKPHFSVLDLGCGKGAVAINLASEFDCKATGIDAVPEFIEAANSYAIKYGVENNCNFQVADIRLFVEHPNTYDLIILGAIGPVLGNMFQTLIKLDKILAPNGQIILDDSFVPEAMDSGYNRCLTENEFYSQIAKAGFSIIREEIYKRSEMDESDNEIFAVIENRAYELMAKHPEKRHIFEDYLKMQKLENQMLLDVLVSGTWFLGRSGNA